MEALSLVGVLLMSVTIAGGAAGGAMALVLHLMSVGVGDRSADSADKAVSVIPVTN
jgi:hypothetical protein